MPFTHTTPTPSQHLRLCADVLPWGKSGGRGVEHGAHQEPRDGRIDTDPVSARPRFGLLLKRHRLSAGLSQEALAERAGVSWRTISDLERGVKQGPRGSTLRLLADALALGTEERAALHASAAPPHEVVAPPVVPSSAPVPTNLPLPLTSFVGRSAEMAAVRRLLGEARLVTLTGAGGCGKTRLALEVARALASDAGRTGDYRDGIWLVELAALSDGMLISQVLAAVLGIPERRGHSVLDSLTAFLRTKHMLLLLDNCEHLLAACAHLADALLRVCSQLTILATSREALHIGGEQPWRVPSFDLPAPLARLTLEQTLASDAVRLFVQRARVSQPDFALTAHNMAQVTLVCRRLDGMPLAIELAAARLSALALDQLAARLDDRFRLLTGGSRTALPRQQTLRATLDWSHDLLDGRRRLLWRRLAVFAGGWTLEAAEAVCAGEGIAGEEVLDLLAGLVAQSLVLLEEGRSGARYGMLETVRQYGQEQLAAAGDGEPVQARHLAWCLALAKQAEPAMGRPAQEGWLERLEGELENLRAALAWSSHAAGMAETGLRLAEALRWFWVVRSHLSEGRRWLEDLLQDDSTAALRARVLDALADITWLQGESTRALALFEESFALHERAGHEASAAHALLGQGMVTVSLGDYPRATTLIEGAAPLLDAHGERHGVAWSLSSLGVILHLQGEHERAAALMRQSLVLFEELGDHYGSGLQASNLAGVALVQGDYGQARHLYRESLALLQRLTARRDFPRCLEGLAVVAMATRQPSRAARLFGAASGLREVIGTPVAMVDRVALDRTVAEAQAALGDRAFALAWAAGQAMALNEAIAYALEDAAI
jgi:predicted ATPase/DNA-binding XRE family transcriptional regulator